MAAHTNGNLSAVLYGANDLRLEQRPIPVLKDDQVLLQMEVVGICGSDVHFFVDGRIGANVVRKPMVIGHEASGTVIKIGKNVTHLAPGDKVAIEPGIPCRLCVYCKTGDYQVCPNVVFCAAPPSDGNLCRYYAHAADFCYKLPANVDLEDGALVEPLAVGVHATKRGKVRVGDAVLILGAGPIGLVTLLAAQAMGASKVLLVDIVDVKLAKAKALGALTLRIQPGQSDQEIIETIRQVLGCDPNKSFECSGAEQCVRIACEITRRKGTVVLVGIGKVEEPLSLSTAIKRELDIKGSFRYSNDYPTAIELISSGKIDVKHLITHHFAMEDTLKAFNTAITQEGNPIKILIHANPKWKPS